MKTGGKEQYDRQQNALQDIFFWGGTDYPDWYSEHGGQTLASTINKYCYITCRTLPPFFEHRHRVVYSMIESVASFEEIRHPSVRETLRFLNLEEGLEIHHDGDLPARSGMGSSSSFTVGLLHALYAHQGAMPHKKRLALESTHIEQNMICETVGSQDQICAAYGGLNHIVFNSDSSFDVRPLTLAKERIQELDSHLMLFYTGIKRTASDVAKSYVQNIEKRGRQLERLGAMVEQGIEILSRATNILDFGALLDEAWQMKRGLSKQVTNDEIDEHYAKAKTAGAIGGKITGAGGGGFMLLFVEPSKQEAVRAALDNLLCVPFQLENAGSQIIFFEPEKEDFSDLARERSYSCPVAGKRID